MKYNKVVTLFSVIALSTQIPISVYAEPAQTTITSENKTNDSLSKMQENDSIAGQDNLTPNMTNTESTAPVADKQQTSNSEEAKSGTETSTSTSEGEEQDKLQKRDVADSEAVNIPDYYLKSAILSSLGIAVQGTVENTPVSKSDLEKLTTLNQSDRGVAIGTLEGLQYATNLTTLSLTKYRSSIETNLLESLTKLKTLTLIGSGSGQISNIDFVKNLTNLTSLNLGQNSISDISILAGLKSITNLSLETNPISAGSISTLGQLTNLVSLKLNATNNKDYSWISTLTKLETLDVSNNKLLDADVTPINTLPALTTLYVQRNQLTDLNTFKNMPSVLLLQAELNKISDLSPLSEYHNVQQVNLKNNNISDITPLTKVTAENANYIMLNGNHIADISGLGDLLNNDGLIVDASNQTVVLPTIKVYKNDKVIVDNPFKSIDGNVPDLTNILPTSGKYDPEKKQIVVDNIVDTSVSAQFIYRESNANFGFSATVRQPIQLMVHGAPVTVKYVDESGKELAASDTLNGDAGTAYTTKEKAISGWMLKETPANATGTFTEGAQTVTYVYEKSNAAPVTVKYVDEEGNELAPSDKLAGRLGDPYESSAKEITGWTLKETPSNATGTFSETEQTVTYVYEKKKAAPITVNYVDESGNELAASDTLEGKVGNPYETTGKVISGWTIKETPTNATGTFTEEAQTVTYVYEKADAAPVTVKYVDGKGKELAPSITLNGKVGDPYETNPETISDWTLKETPSNAIGIFTEEAQTVTYVYEKADAAPVTVKYVDGEGNELATPGTLNGKIGDPYETTAKELAGWTVKETPKNASGIFTKQAQTVTYVYEKADAAPITVKYVDGGGNELTAPDTLNGKIGDPYETTAKEIAGWTLKETPTNATGTFTKEAQTVTYVYEKADAAPVTVKYEDEKGNELGTPDTLNGKIGDPYETIAKEIAGWTVKETPKNASGTFTEEAQIVTYVYEKADAAPVTVKYEDEKGNELSTPDTFNGKIGDPYETTAKELAGWTLKETPTNAIGTFTKEAQTVTYIYEKADAAPVTVKYVNEDGGELIASDTLNGKIGDPYETTSKEIAGWTLKETPTNATGMFTKEAQTVTYIYEKADAAPVTVKYEDEKGNELATPDTLNGKIGDPYETTAKELTGWIVKETPKNASGIFTKEAQTVTYVYEKADAAPVTIKYEDEKGNELATPDTLNGKIGDPYETIAKEIAGWTLKEAPTNAIGTFTKEAQTVTYVYEKADAAPITVKYEDEKGNELAKPDNLNGKIGASYKTNAKQISGWSVKEKPTNATGTFKADPQTVIYIYEKANAGVVTVKYVDEKGNELATSITLNGKIGDPYKSEPKDLTGWKLKSTPENEKGYFSEKAQSVIYVYKNVDKKDRLDPTNNDSNKNNSNKITSQNNDSYTSYGSKSYPKTGESKSNHFIIAGMSALVVVAIATLIRVVYKKKKID
ncbi:MucBP domain-containing protein [Enterococcus gilvus]|uniref:MucBP domain-containing protein n=1 Tax=Enterococcus gilvus TaxID=160453 RepID=UPI003D6B1D61